MRVKQRALDYEFKEFQQCVHEWLRSTKPAAYFNIDLLLRSLVENID